MALTENLDFFLKHHGVEVVIGEPGDEMDPIKGIYDGPHRGFEDGYGGVSSTAPTIKCKSSDVDDLAQGIPVFVTGKGNFLLNEVQPDGTGFSVVILERA